MFGVDIFHEYFILEKIKFLLRQRIFVNVK